MIDPLFGQRDPRHQRGLNEAPPYLAIFKALMKLLSYLKTSSHERFLSCRRWPLPRYAGNIFLKTSEAVTLRVETVEPLKFSRCLEPKVTLRWKPTSLCSCATLFRIRCHTLMELRRTGETMFFTEKSCRDFSSRP